ncbi:class II aldolase/adducin family protein [Terriglobus sp.]|uniref:class II aldolase/adducin family protein n=1 Tax=Terriglobus sp. TaxID=1889013 RepID=UPI003AFF9156
MNMTASDRELVCRREIVRYSRRLSQRGFMPGTAGNLSAMIDEARILVTPTGVCKGLLKASDLVIVDLQGNLLEGTRGVTSELGMHLTIYQNRADVRAVVHAHPPISTAFACSSCALDELLCQESVMTVGPVPLAPYATTGTSDVATSLAPFLCGHDAILLENHGVVTYGKTLTEALLNMETVEHIAQVALVAHQLGRPRPLHPEQVQQLRAARNRYLDAAGRE